MKILQILTLLTGLFIYSVPASADMTTCKIHYTLKGWSFLYKIYRGNGSIICQNGQQARVKIISQGGGPTIGKSEIANGKGIFSEVRDIHETFGTYIALDAHAGVVRSVEGLAMTKGEVSLALTGKGRGFDLGFALEAFTIRPL